MQNSCAKRVFTCSGSCSGSVSPLKVRSNVVTLPQMPLVECRQVLAAAATQHDLLSFYRAQHALVLTASHTPCPRMLSIRSRYINKECIFSNKIPQWNIMAFSGFHLSIHHRASPNRGRGLPGAMARISEERHCRNIE